MYARQIFRERVVPIRKAERSPLACDQKGLTHEDSAKERIRTSVDRLPFRPRIRGRGYFRKSGLDLSVAIGAKQYTLRSLLSKLIDADYRRVRCNRESLL